MTHAHGIAVVHCRSATGVRPAVDAEVSVAFQGDGCRRVDPRDRDGVGGERTLAGYVGPVDEIECIRNPIDDRN